MIFFTIFLFLTGAGEPARSASTLRVPGTVEILVTDRSGAPLAPAHVNVYGPSEREGDTSTTGRVMFVNMKPGTYSVHVELDAFIALEKQFTLSPGQPASVVAALSPNPAGAFSQSAHGFPVWPGNARALSIPDLAKKQSIGHEPMKELLIGCSGAATARMIQVREPLTVHAHRGAAEMFYVHAGEGTLRIGGADQRIFPGPFNIVPRRPEYYLVRKGRNPVVLLSLLSGQPCVQGVASTGAAR